MQKKITAQSLSLLMIVAMLFLTVQMVFAAERLIVKDDAGTQTFSVEESGDIYTKGT